MTDEEILSAAVTAADELDATRVHEMKSGKWHATTIFDGDTGLIRFGRLVEKAVLAKRAEEKTPPALNPGAAWPFPPDRRPGKYRLVYNKATKRIDKVSNVDGLVAESFDPPQECSLSEEHRFERTGGPHG